MRISVETRSLSDLDTGNNLLQSGFWGAFKAEERDDAFGFFVRTGAGDFPLLVIIRPLGGIRYGYVPHGPAIRLPEERQGQLLESLSKTLHRFLPGECRFLRYDTLWNSPYDDDSSRNGPCGWNGPPGTPFREMRMNASCEDWSLRKAATDLQPTDTVLIDLDRDEEAILGAMRPNTRNLIRRSRRSGVRVRSAPARELPRWYRLYRRTAERKGFRPQDPAYFTSLFDLAARWGSGGPDLRFLTAEADGDLTAGAIVALFGERAYYLYAAAAPEAAAYAPSYALQWEAIRSAKRAGCSEYDLYGIPPNDDPAHPMHGLYRFKTGFGGRIVHRRGCWDYPFDRERYEGIRGIEPSLGGYHA